MNVIFVGDFVQLRPRGTSLATIPSRLRRRMIPSQAELPAQLALDLLWGDDNLKLLELTEQSPRDRRVVSRGTYSMAVRLLLCDEPRLLLWKPDHPSRQLP